MHALDVYISIHEVAKTSTSGGDCQVPSPRISIHEVAKTSTIYRIWSIQFPRFQSTRSQRPRHDACQFLNVLYTVFQSTRSQRPRPRRKRHGQQSYYFNPRGRKDLDKFRGDSTVRQSISIHEAAKTSTGIPIDAAVAYNISIHEAAKTSTWKQNFRRQQAWHFNPRGRKDLDKDLQEVAANIINFNPRGRKDLDVYIFDKFIPPFCYFNPRGRKDLD